MSKPPDRTPEGRPRAAAPRPARPPRPKAPHDPAGRAPTVVKAGGKSGTKTSGNVVRKPAVKGPAKSAVKPGATRPHRRLPRLDAGRLAVRDRRRVGVFLVLVCVLFGVIAMRLVDLQVVQADQWRHEAFVQSAATVALPADRGTILDRNGRDLATSVSRDAVFADPMLVQDAPYYAHSLAPLLGVSESDLRAELTRHRITVSGKSIWSRYASLAPAVSSDVSAEIDAMRFPGVYTRPEPQREYPDGNLASAVLGRTVPGNNGPVGASGIEAQYQESLAGTPGLLETERDQQGVPIPMSQRRYQPARPGRNVQLTIDEGVQYQAERVLLDEVAAQSARGGMATIIDIHTGDVIAMATVVGAHGSKPAHVATANDANEPVSFTYSPGSVMKIVPVSTAIESGACSASTTFTVPDAITNGRFVIHDDEVHNPQVMNPDDILVASSNVGTTLLTQRCVKDPVVLDSALRRFGFGAKTGVNLPHEEHGLLVPPDRYYDSGLAANAIGYSLTATPLQVLDAYTTIARGGVPVVPRIVSATIDASGHRYPVPVRTGTRVVSAATAATMRGFFSDVVTRGTGVCGAIPDYAVGGKTGTAQKLSGGSFTSAAHVATFVGFGGTSQPELAAIVSIDEPRDVYGARTAAPVFSEIMRYALAEMRVAPLAPSASPTTQWAQAAQNVPKGTSCSVPHGAALAQLEAAQLRATTQTTTPGTATTTTVPTSSTTVASSKTHTTAASHGTGPTSTTVAHTPTTVRRSPPTSTTPTTKATSPTTAAAKPGAAIAVPVGRAVEPLDAIAPPRRPTTLAIPTTKPARSGADRS